VCVSVFSFNYGSVCSAAVISCVFGVFFLGCCMFVSTGAVHCLERLLSEITAYVSTEM